MKGSCLLFEYLQELIDSSAFSVLARETGYRVLLAGASAFVFSIIFGRWFISWVGSRKLVEQTAKGDSEHLEEFVEGVVLVQAGDAVEQEHRSWDHDGIDGCGLDDLGAHVEQLLKDYTTMNRHNLCGLGQAFEAAVHRAVDDLEGHTRDDNLVERIAKLEETVTVLANGLRTTFGSLRALP